ncbi:hypothetical protein BD309DRAFT_956227 [Dichomitus squalens]|uniref:Uncharacterized protein n=1 Tax=Dichomitus squalens TaxID=114155 RepID=A0A4Q9PMM4_9APHY|nr:uncharacterized protein DICSQDRAFT_178958 [Dichomitus squalens LYAD-421 SS1]EJF63680.1 hypothetical protein DICSQDRAFT_178958 [Dichomitus squalens LYAD-421 SS1]TBU45462.1 hypothetical protein BD309DRAFT_956227 [Dichomitus squalens]TBU55490.1 hypothetical protein BD310DRAFT_681222 [Dichomitus squalens]
MFSGTVHKAQVAPQDRNLRTYRSIKSGRVRRRGSSGSHIPQSPARKHTNHPQPCSSSSPPRPPHSSSPSPPYHAPHPPRPAPSSPSRRALPSPGTSPCAPSTSPPSARPTLAPRAPHLPRPCATSSSARSSPPTFWCARRPAAGYAMSSAWRASPRTSASLPTSPGSPSRSCSPAARVCRSRSKSESQGARR